MKIQTKYILGILLSSLILIFSAYGIKYYLEVSATKLTKQIDIIEKNTYDGNLSLAQENILVLEKTWKEIEPKWSFLTNHLNLEHIVTCLEDSITFIRFKDIPNFISNLKILKQHIEHVPQVEEFNLKNIL